MADDLGHALGVQNGHLTLYQSRIMQTLDTPQARGWRSVDAFGQVQACGTADWAPEDTVERLAFFSTGIEYREARRGDQRRTVADIGRARAVLGWESQVEPEAGLHAEVRWVQERLAGSPVSSR